MGTIYMSDADLYHVYLYIVSTGCLLTSISHFCYACYMRLASAFDTPIDVRYYKGHIASVKFGVSERWMVYAMT
jgi:hypothetical protein